MEQFEPIKLMQGATTVVNLDLADFDFQGGTVVLVMRELVGGKVLREWEFAEQGVHACVFEDEFTATLKLGKYEYEYDIMWHLDGERFAQCAPSPVEVCRTVGGYPHGADDQD